MKKFLILGAGSSGTMLANLMTKKLPQSEWEITIVDKDNIHYYQPGFLFIPFGIYKESEIVKPKDKFIPKGVKFIVSEIDKIEADKNTVLLKDGSKLNYDLLVIGTGVDIYPEETTGLKGELWHKKIFDFYTLEGATKLQAALKEFKGGKVAVNIVETPIKCPIAPLEMSFILDDYFKKKRNKK